MPCLFMLLLLFNFDRILKGLYKKKKKDQPRLIWMLIMFYFQELLEFCDRRVEEPI